MELEEQNKKIVYELGDFFIFIRNKYKVKIKFRKFDITIVAKYVENSCRTESTIFFNKRYNLSKDEMICTMFHELGHQYCCNNDLFYAYHHIDNDFENYFNKFKRTALKAERFIDKWAAKEMKENGFEIIYDFPYSDRARTQRFKKKMEEYIRLKREYLSEQ